MPVKTQQRLPPEVMESEQASKAAGLEHAELPGGRGARKAGELRRQTESGLDIPAILLEGDEPVSVPLTGPGQKFALGPSTAEVRAAPEEAVLPEAYGTGELLLAARDPHWLYAHWDLTPSQQRHYNALSADRHLVLRVYPRAVMEPPVREVHVHPESRHWFVHVDRADTQYVAELGYYPPGRQWVTVAVSPPTVAPAAAVSTDQTVRFATVPADVRLGRPAAPIKQLVPPTRPPVESAPLDVLGEQFLTVPAEVPPGELAPLTNLTAPVDLPPVDLAEMVGPYLGPQEWTSSAEVGEVVRGRSEQEAAAEQFVRSGPSRRRS